MIQYITGNILDSSADALINTVNTDGVMGKGIALQFKKAYPNNFKAYVDACRNKNIGIGKLFLTTEKNLATPEKIIINFPTKISWQKPSEYNFIIAGLDDLVRIVQTQNIKSLAIPPLGAGNGGLDWQKVKTIIVEKLNHLDALVYVYEPTDNIREVMKQQRIKLTDARALLLYVAYDLARNGEYLSEFASEKICYFLQRFGAEPYFKLNFQPNFYGPYSGKVRFVLNALNGSYIMGYSDMNKKPFEPLVLVADGYDVVKIHIENNPTLYQIAQRTMHFLNGFYSDFALELLSSIDYLATTYNTIDKPIIIEKLTAWSSRKSNLFASSRHIDISLAHIQAANLLH
jgi:O-acetyl-ADP-ribose deacetylase (regulator of RNase III)